MYIRLSSLRQTRFGYADSAFCLLFSLPIFLFIYNMLNNLKSVTLFPIFFKKNFYYFFCARRTICRRTRQPLAGHFFRQSGHWRYEVSTPMRCIAPIKVISKTEQSSEKYLQELPIKGFVLEAVPLSSLEHKTDEPYAGRANKGLFAKPPIHWQMMPKEYFGLRFAFKARA